MNDGTYSRLEIRESMASIWVELLELEHTQEIPNDAYFLDLGGNSLQANIFVGRVQETFGVELTFEQVFDLNLSELADCI
jgi:acyl carrier protein